MNRIRRDQWDLWVVPALVVALALPIHHCTTRPKRDTPQAVSVFSPIDRGAVLSAIDGAAPAAPDSFVLVLLCGVGPMTTAYQDSADASRYIAATPRPSASALFYVKHGTVVVFRSNAGCVCP